MASQFPHKYFSSASSSMDSPIDVTTDVGMMKVTPPVQFDGDNEEYSPEDLFSMAISSCFILTLKSLSRFKKLPWLKVEVNVTAMLDKVAGEGLMFSEALMEVRLDVTEGADIAVYAKLLADAEKGCLVTKSLKTKVHLKPKVIIHPLIA